MKIIRDCSDSWNKFGWYQPSYSQDIQRVKKWHIMQSSNWTPPIPRASVQRLFNSRKKYKASLFNIIRTYQDSVLIWNTASECVISLSLQEYNTLIDFLTSQVSNSLDLISSLYDLGVIIDKSEDEFFKMDFLRKRSITNVDNVKSFIIIPTTKCNARCFYCFASGDTKTQKTMTPKVVKEVVDFIVSQLRPEDEVVYRWFGGEPLLAASIIDQIVKGVHDLSPSTSYHSIITTNSSLMSDKMIENAITNWHLRKIQIPIDGYKDQHDKRKNYSDGKSGQYSQVLTLVEKLLNRGIYTTIRFNLDLENVIDFEKVLSDFHRFKTFNNFYFQSIPLHTPKNTSNLNKYVSSNGYHDFYKVVYGMMQKAGYLTDINRLLPRRAFSVCTAMLNNFFLINADGYLYRCDQELHSKQNSVGHCRTGVFHNANLSKWLDDSLADECVQCSFLPICQGGCKFYRFRNDPNLKPCVEHKFIYDVLLDIVYGMQKT